SLRQVVPKNYNPKGERFLIASRFSTPPLACALFIPRATVKQVDYWPSDTPVCYLCTCERCGNILNYWTCQKCNSGTGNSFTYDPIPESFDEVQVIPNPPPQCHFNIYLCVDPLIDHHCCYKCGNSLNGFFCHHCTCEFCGNGAHVGYNCPAQVLSFQTLPSFPQHYLVVKIVGFFLKLTIVNPHNIPSIIQSSMFIMTFLIPKLSSWNKLHPCVKCDDQSLYDEDVRDKIFSNPLFEEEISMKIDQHHDNAESDLVESTLNHDSSIIPSSLKIDSLLDEFAGELTLLESIPPGIDKTDSDPEEDIRLIERFLYVNSSPRPPEEFVSENSNAEIESFSPSPILIKDSDSLMKEIDLSYTPDDPTPPGIKEDDDDSERDILILEELLDNYFLSLPENESYHFDIPSFSRSPAKPPDGNTGILNVKMMGDISDQKVPIPGLTLTRVPNQEKSPDLLSHRGFETFQPFTECPMVIHGKNIPILDVPLFHFYPLDQFKYRGNLVKLSDLKQALHGKQPMLINSLVFLFSS
nr:hypothetical protein [Tanacetum cinerariifolium]